MTRVMDNHLEVMTDHLEEDPKAGVQLMLVVLVLDQSTIKLLITLMTTILLEV